jgi:hypothetical protein
MNSIGFVFGLLVLITLIGCKQPDTNASSASSSAFDNCKMKDLYGLNLIKTAIRSGSVVDIEFTNSTMGF